MIQAYTDAQETVGLPDTERVRVICIDEMGPVSAKTYPGAVWKDSDGLRATYDADYGRRGKTWVFGAFEPATGKAVTRCSPRRDSAGFVALLDQVIQEYPAKNWVFIWDNLSVHYSKESRLALVGHAETHSIRVLPMPKYAAWLNLIEPWWKTLRSLALKGRCFETVEDVTNAIKRATDYWNQHAKPYRWGTCENRTITPK